MNPIQRILSRLLIIVWIANCSLACFMAIQHIWIPYMNAGADNYTHISGPSFDGTSMPIAYVPDWTKIANQDKSKRFEDISINEFIPIPRYDPIVLTREGSSDKNTLLSRYTYPVVYMGNYKLDYRENAGGHLGIDIRAPIGTPVLSIANGVVIRTMPNGDSTGNKFIVVRHDNVPYEGKVTTLYSGYLHLSDIVVKEGDIVRKGEMIGRVGITGITTTPHLHFQIDTSDAPFHPYWHFTSADSKSAGVGFFDSVNIGINKDLAVRYTIHPLNFINLYLLGYNGSSNNNSDLNNPILESPSEKNTASPTVSAYFTEIKDDCIGKRFSDVGTKSNFGNTLYPLVDKKCLFSEQNTSLGVKETITYREALMNTMRYFDIPPATGVSHFLDIPLGDAFQGYALAAYRKGILTGNYANPNYIMTRQDIAKLIVSVHEGEGNPSEMQIYNDVDRMNPMFGYIQDYAYLTRARGGKFFPKTLVTRGTFVKMLSSVKE